jgi:Methyl-accepting chemotaxis protein
MKFFKRDAAKDIKNKGIGLKFGVMARILGAFIFTIVFLGILSFTAIGKISEVKNNFSMATSVYVPGIKTLGDINTAVVEYRRLETKITSVKDDNELKSLEDNLTQIKDKLTGLENDYLSRAESNSTIDKSAFNTFKSNLDKYIASSQDAISKAKSGDKEAAENIILTSESTYNSISKDLSTLTEQNYSAVNGMVQKFEKLYGASRRGFLIISIIFIVVIIGVSIAATLNISKPIKKLQKIVDIIAQGDLSQGQVTVHRKDEIGKLASSIDNMVSEFRDIIVGVGAGADQIAGSSQELAAGVEQTSKAAEEINTSVEEVTGGVEEQSREMESAFQTFDEMSRGINLLNSNIDTSSAAAVDAVKQAKEGEKVSNSAIESMGKIAGHVYQIMGIMEELKGKSDNVESIVSTISGIARQTNMLALNAAIEAARAGESGRGFAVVADEVKKLAVQSSDATKEISDIIGAIKSDIENTVLATSDGAKFADEGLSVINNAGEMFRGITSEVESLAAKFQEIAAASQQIASGSEKVRELISNTSKISKDTSANMENVAASVEEQSASMQQISAHAGTMNRMAEEFRSRIKKYKL